MLKSSAQTTPTKFIPVNEPIVSRQAKQYVIEALDSGWISSAGPFIDKFETKFASFLGVKHAITVSNGTAALHVALLSLGIGSGDEVIVPAFTMAATWLAVIYVGAKPVFVDCELTSYNLDPDQIEAVITPKTKAIIPVHIYGHAAEMNEIMRIADKHHLHVIEDAAEAHGGEYRGKKCGSLGHIGCFSFYANKIITSGEGGMVVTNDDNLAYEMRKLKDLYHSDKKRFIHEKIGYNYRLTNLQAAVGLGELHNVNKYISKKLKMAQLYGKYLSDIPGVILPKTKPYVKNVYWMYAIRIDPDKYGMTKDSLRMRLREANIDTRDFFYSPSAQPVLKRFLKSRRFPNTELIAQQGFYLPSGLKLTQAQIRTVARAIKDNMC